MVPSPDPDRPLRGCAICGRADPAPLPRYRRAHLARCRGCGLVFAAREPSEAELAANYGGYSRADLDSPITRQRYRELLGEFEAYRRSGRILDMGCGIGFFLEEAERAGWEAYGSEFEARAIEIVRAKGLRCVRAPIATDALEPGSFDVITAFEVVEHLQDPRAEAATIARLLRPGGLFYCTTPNFGALSRWLLRDRWAVIEYPEHLTYFTPGTLRAWLGGFGFEAEKVRTTGVGLARLRGGLGRSAAPELGSEEDLRARIEGSATLHAAKATLNGLLVATRMGDTIKGRFVLRAPLPPSYPGWGRG